jgi:glycosyltransferase involved in cell wall biosynthesis
VARPFEAAGAAGEFSPDVALGTAELRSDVRRVALHEPACCVRLAFAQKAPLRPDRDLHVVFVTAKVPPAKDGVGDYCYQLGKELARQCRVTIVTTIGQRAEDDGNRFRIMPIVSSWDTRALRDLETTIAALQPSVINVQWVPYLWGRRGINFAVPLAALRLRRAGYFTVGTIHEAYVRFDAWSRLITGWPQRLQFLLLMLASSRIVVTTSAWRRNVLRMMPWRAEDVFSVPVGSNIPASALAADRATLRQTLGFNADDIVATVFSPFSAGKMLSTIGEAWTALGRRHRTLKLVVIGCTLDELQRRCPSGVWDGVDCTGYIPPAEVSRRLISSDLLLAPLLDGVSTRRTSIVAALAHGVPVVTTRGPLTDEGFFDESPLVLTDPRDVRGFLSAVDELIGDAGRRTALGDQSRQFFEERFSWPVVASGFLRACRDLEWLHAQSAA